MTYHRLRSAIIMCLLTAGGVLGCRRTPSQDPTLAGLPTTLHGLPLVTVHEGEAAARMIGDLHGLDVAPVESRVAVYAIEGLEALLYVSRFPDDSTATEQVAAMGEAIGEGSSGFAHHTVQDVAGTAVHAVAGHGQSHFFFARGAEVLWLAAPPMMARMLLAEVLGVEPAALPADSSGGAPPTIPVT